MRFPYAARRALQTIAQRDTWMILGAALLASQIAVGANAAILNVGDPAPAIQVGSWIQGEPVTELERDKAYLIEFWATWCGPCVQGIPHLNAIHLKYKDHGLIVIGQAVSKEDQGKVKPFCAKMGSQMTYRVALDDYRNSERGAMSTNWYDATGQRGIPAAILVAKDGRIAWIGHPIELKESIIEQVLAGTFDMDNAIKSYRKQSELEPMWEKVLKQMNDGQWEQVDATLDELAKQIPPEKQEDLNFTRLRSQALRGDFKTAVALAEQMVQSSTVRTNATRLHFIGFILLLERKDLPPEAIEFAGKIVAQANELAKGKDAEILSTLARAKFLRGIRDEAIRLQQQAIDLTDEPHHKKRLQVTLDLYKSEQR